MAFTPLFVAPNNLGNLAMVLALVHGKGVRRVGIGFTLTAIRVGSAAVSVLHQ
jgi:hypothetical protein